MGPYVWTPLELGAAGADELSKRIKDMLNDSKDFYIIVQAACGIEQRERRLKLRPPYLRRALSSNGQIGITQFGILNGNRFRKAIRIPPRLASLVVVVQSFRLAIA